MYSQYIILYILRVPSHPSHHPCTFLAPFITHHQRFKHSIQKTSSFQQQRSLPKQTEYQYCCHHRNPTLRKTFLRLFATCHIHCKNFLGVPMDLEHHSHFRNNHTIFYIAKTQHFDPQCLTQHKNNATTPTHPQPTRPMHRTGWNMPLCKYPKTSVDQTYPLQVLEVVLCIRHSTLL